MKNLSKWFVAALMILSTSFVSFVAVPSVAVQASKTEISNAKSSVDYVVAVRDYSLYPTATFTATGTTYTTDYVGLNTTYSYFSDATYWITVQTGVSATLYITPQLSNDNTNWVDFNAANAMTFTTTGTQYATVSVVGNNLRLKVTKTQAASVAKVTAVVHVMNK